MEGRNDLGEEGEVEGSKREMPHPDFQGPLPGRTGIVPLKGEATPPITMEVLLKVAEPAVDEGENSLGVGVVIVGPIRQLLCPVVGVVAEWGAGVAKTSVYLLLLATKMSQREMESVADMDRIGPSTTQPGLETEVKLAVRVQSMRKSLREEGREVQRLAVRVVEVTLVIQTRRRTRNPTPRMALNIPTPLVPCHLHHPELPRSGYLPPEVYLLEEEGVEALEEEETPIGVTPMLEEHLGVTGLDPTQLLMVDPPSHLPQTESSKVFHKALGPKTLAKWVMEERRKTR